MRATRRSLLPLPLLAVVAGCTPDPTVSGTPGPAPEPPTPTRGPEAAALATWAEEFGGLVDGLAAGAGSWGADDVHVAWLDALTSQSDAHLARLVTQDPVAGGPTVFPVPSSVAAAAPGPSTPEEAVAVVAAKVEDGAPLFQASIASAGSGAERLFHASLSSAAAGSLNPALPPAEGGVEPAPFPDPDLPGSLGVALSHVWALIRGIELGLGRLDRSDALRDAGTQRLDEARVLRNTVLAAISGEPPGVETWSLPNDMLTAGEIRDAWAVLETNVLDALGVLVAADATGFDVWLDAMLKQVPWVHRWGGRLSHWPGWVDAS